MRLLGAIDLRSLFNKICLKLVWDARVKMSIFGYAWRPLSQLLRMVANAQVGETLVEVIALILLPVAIMMCAYSLAVFIMRARAISKKQVPPHPVVLRGLAITTCQLYLFLL